MSINVQKQCLNLFRDIFVDKINTKFELKIFIFFFVILWRSLR